MLEKKNNKNNIHELKIIFYYRLPKGSEEFNKKLKKI